LRDKSIRFLVNTIPIIITRIAKISEVHAAISIFPLAVCQIYHIYSEQKKQFSLTRRDPLAIASPYPGLKSTKISMSF